MEDFDEFGNPLEKQYYPTALEIYGPQVETMVEEEDTQPLTQPIIQPEKKQAKKKLIPHPPLLQSLIHNPDRIYTFALVGSLHSGKSSYINLLQEHSIIQNPLNFQFKFDFQNTLITDTNETEIKRKISLHSKPAYIVIEIKNKSHLLQIIDTPGHSELQDETLCGLSVADGIILMLDITEGVTQQIKSLIGIINSCYRNNRCILFLNKIDRFVLELKLPPQDTYFKIRNLILEINELFGSQKFDINQNVIFGSCYYGFTFTLQSFAQVYLGKNEEQVEAFASNLFGDVYFQDGEFVKNGDKRSFVALVLEPIYKLISASISYDKPQLKKLLNKYKIYLKKNE